MSKKKKRMKMPAALPQLTPQADPGAPVNAKRRTIIIAVLLIALLGLGSAGVIVKLSQNTVVSALQPDAPQASATPENQPHPSTKVVVYYFHGTARCSSCQTIEELTHFAVTDGFQSELKEGSLEFHAINAETPENRHFIQDYQLYTKSVIVSTIVNGKEARWKNLEKIWQLYYDQKAFVDYIQQEIRAYMQKSH